MSTKNIRAILSGLRDVVDSIEDIRSRAVEESYATEEEKSKNETFKKLKAALEMELETSRLAQYKILPDEGLIRVRAHIETLEWVLLKLKEIEKTH